MRFCKDCDAYEVCKKQKCAKPYSWECGLFVQSSDSSSKHKVKK